MSSRLRLVLRDLQTDVSSFHLLKYARRVDGFLFSSKNSGTHWLRAMLSAAIAHHLGLPPPAYSHGPEADAYIGHPKKPRPHHTAPRIGCSHTIPSRLTLLPIALGLATLPPTVVLARHIPDALVSYFVKWRGTGQHGVPEDLSDFVRRPPPGERRVDDVWWFVRFFNRWGEIARMAPRQVMVVRYSQLQSDPAAVIERIWSHWGVDLDRAAIAAGVEAGRRQHMIERLDPTWDEAVVSDPAARAQARLSPEDRALLWRIMAEHLRYSLWPTGAEAPASAGAQALGPRPLAVTP